MALILASGSPRRKELLRLITPDFTVRVSDAEENADPAAGPAAFALQNARAKGEAVFAGAEPGDVVVSADTVVCADGRILGKPRTAAEAEEMLSLLSGRTHEVYTGVFILRAGKSAAFSVGTEVEFYPLSPEEIRAYVHSGEPFDKAGGYGIQTGGALFVKEIRGDYFNVVGFPVARVARELRAFI